VKQGVFIEIVKTESDKVRVYNTHTSVVVGGGGGGGNIRVKRATR